MCVEKEKEGGGSGARALSAVILQAYVYVCVYLYVCLYVCVQKVGGGGVCGCSIYGDFAGTVCVCIFLCVLVNFFWRRWVWGACAGALSVVMSQLYVYVCGYVCVFVCVVLCVCGEDGRGGACARVLCCICGDFAGVCLRECIFVCVLVRVYGESGGWGRVRVLYLQ